MKIKDIRALSKEELKEKISDLRKELMDFEFKRSGNLEKPHVFRVARKTIARILTVLKEKENETNKR
ncbi:MAG: 50S ribosomal protein L29 [Candidatus Omnitrophica bacterium]|jgi:large subunit ribosomal protein L29|nr:50S ribosomal protein L29 [Candidatus Omnitrophota bacterium]